MSAEGPKEYPVVYDSERGLQYSFQSGYVVIPEVSTNSLVALTGDVTATGPGTTSTLATVNSSVGSYTNASITVNAKGLVTAASSGSAPATYTAGSGLTLTGGAFSITTSYLPLTGGTLTGVLTPASSTNAATTGYVTPVTGATNYFYTVSANTTINGPATPTADGQKVTFRILNDASHSVTLALGAGQFRFGTDITGYTNSVSLTDYIGAIWNAGAGCWDVVAVIQGF